MVFVAFWAFHAMLVDPLVTLGGVASDVFQARKILSRRSLGTLSLLGLTCQAIVFAMVGYSGVFRLQIERRQLNGATGWAAFVASYQLVGWAAVDSFVFAIVQATLFAVALERKWSNQAHEENRFKVDETASLLPRRAP